MIKFAGRAGSSDLLPDIKYIQLGSTARLVTASKWATIELIILPK